LRLFQIGLRALHDFFHRQVRSERESSFFELLRAETEIAVGAGQQIVLKPLLVILESGGGSFLTVPIPSFCGARSRRGQGLHARD